MKKVIVYALLTALINVALAQTVHRVNNNPGVTGTRVYSTFAAAHTAAAANDIIIIEPSGTSYGDITLTKPLKIYGNGYYLDVNRELKEDKRSSILGTVEFNTGSGGSELYGVTLAGGIFTIMGNIPANSISIYGVSNITISRCLPGSTNFLVVRIFTANKAGTTNSNVSNLLITQNHRLSILPQGNTGFIISDVQVNNNLFSWEISAGTGGIIQNWIVRNNTFIQSTTVNLANGLLENNLFANGGSVSFGQVTFRNNISTGNTFPDENNGNRNNYSTTVVVDPEDPSKNFSQFIGTGPGISDDERWQLREGAELKTLGTGGSEVGAYGGVTPYVVSGIPPIPSVVSMILTETADTANPVKATISVKSNN